MEQKFAALETQQNKLTTPIKHKAKQFDRKDTKKSFEIILVKQQIKELSIVRKKIQNQN